MALTHETDHAGLASARLLAQFKNKPLLTGRLAAICKQIQAIEDALWTLVTALPFPDATGDALSRWGALVGEPRPTGLDDATYRPLVQARIFENISNGRVEDAFSILRALGATDALYRLIAPATILLQEQGALAATDAELGDFLEGAMPPVAIHVNQFPAVPFGFAADASAAGFDVGGLGRTIQ